MDCDDIEFDEELNKFYLPCLNNNYVRKDRVLCYCDYHETYVSKTQAKKRKCLQKQCKHARKVKCD